MSDDLATFTSKLDAMLARIETQTAAITERWLMKCHARIVLLTMGPGNQWPETEYIAVGRLRQGYTWGLEAPASVPINRDRPLTDETQYGDETVARLDAELLELGVQPQLMLYNVVGYGWYVHWGEGTHSHIGPRPYLNEFANSAEPEALLAAAAAEVMAGGVD